MESYGFTELTEEAVSYAAFWASKKRKEFITPEMVLVGLTVQKAFGELAAKANIDTSAMRMELQQYIDQLDDVEEGEEYMLEVSMQTHQMFEEAQRAAKFSGIKEINVPNLIRGILALDDSMAAYVLRKYLGSDDAHILLFFNDAYGKRTKMGHGGINTFTEEEVAEMFDNMDIENGVLMQKDGWKQLVTCIDEKLVARHPLVGREEEIERTIQILCRKEKNNPLHIGEPGVGKTTLIYGLAAKIFSGDVPEDLKKSKIYSVDLGTILAGSQLRGEFERKLKSVLEGVKKEQGGILYIDEIHNLIGAGQIGESSMDASSLLLPYLEDGTVRFIGSTTYQDYSRHMERSKGVVRRFQRMDITEPSVDDTVTIINGLLPSYEKYHGVKYDADAVRYAVEKSSSLIADRFLPDKAIDIIDEAGAYRKLHPLYTRNGNLKPKRSQMIDRKVMADILARVCKVDAKALSEDSNELLKTLAERISNQIYGQDEAIKSVVEAVQMSKAGLLDSDKPLASLLFVGPTGVGKTEVCKVLAQELGIKLVRFDMSEYTEKHTVAKLIGSPAGYVGYEDGGLLTDAIRKTPNCVLLLDEIEKAHSDIYNILLQVMDYARLTDSRGNKADFKNVILIMTSNAGAQYAGAAGIGFTGGVTRGDSMLQTVKKTFKPEFLNRLSGTVVFRDMDMTMASLILDKKLRQLGKRLETKDVTLKLSDEARQFLLSKGYTKQYGAREMDRTLQHWLNPLLMREILFGKLRKGGCAEVTLDGGKLTIDTPTPPVKAKATPRTSKTKKAQKVGS